MDFGANGVWVWNAGVWAQILPADPESLLAAQVDQIGGNADDEIIADLGTNGVWVWNGGGWTVNQHHERREPGGDRHGRGRE